MKREKKARAADLEAQLEATSCDRCDEHFPAVHLHPKTGRVLGYCERLPEAIDGVPEDVEAKARALTLHPGANKAAYELGRAAERADVLAFISAYREHVEKLRDEWAVVVENLIEGGAHVGAAKGSNE